MDTPHHGRWFEDLPVGLVVPHALTRTITETDNILFTTMTLNPEVQDAFWVPFRALQTPGVRGEVTIDHPGIPRRVLPAYTLGKHTIWGMSERILTPLISLVS